MIWKVICANVLAIFAAMSLSVVVIVTFIPVIPSFWFSFLFMLFMYLSTAVFFWTVVYIMRTELKIDLLQQANIRLRKDDLKNLKIIIRLAEKLKQKED